MQPYVIRQGDHLCSLAYRYGFDAETVWNHPTNAELRQTQKVSPDPNALNPTDMLYIPDAAPPEMQDLNTGSTNTFVADVPTEALNVTFTQGDGTPCASMSFTVQELVGHGGPAQSENPPSQPQEHLQTSFDLLPEMGGFSAHRFKMTAQVFELWQALKGPVKPILSSPDSRAVNDVLTVMQQAGAAMKTAGIRRFIVLSCAVGLGTSGPSAGLPDGPRFAQALANLLGVAVVAYQGWVATNDVARAGSPQQLHLWISPTHDPPSREPAASTDTTRPEFHEVPMDLSVAKLPAAP